MEINMSTTKDLINIELLKQVRELTKKEEKKKPWYDMQLTAGQLIKAYLFMLLSYPFLGPLVKWAVLKMW